MSPIGRVFIVLNLGLAVGFLMVSGTYLQQTHNYKSLLEKEQVDRAAEVQALTQQVTRAESDRNTFEVAKTASETGWTQAKNQIDGLLDEKKRLDLLTQEQAALLKTNTALLEANQTEVKAAFERANAAYAMSTADQKTKDEAVNAKNESDATNRTLRTTIASMEETIKNKDLAIAGLSKDKNELGLLVAVAKAKGFMESMAAPNLAGTVTNASGNLCTILVSDNPGNIDIQEHLNSGSWSFAIYDASGYKGEAVPTKYEASANALLCNVRLVKGVIKEGDKASTNTN